MSRVAFNQLKKLQFPKAKQHTWQPPRQVVCPFSPPGYVPEKWIAHQHGSLFSPSSAMCHTTQPRQASIPPSESYARSTDSSWHVFADDLGLRRLERLTQRVG